MDIYTHYPGFNPDANCYSLVKNGRNNPDKGVQRVKPTGLFASFKVLAKLFPEVPVGF